MAFPVFVVAIIAAAAAVLTRRRLRDYIRGDARLDDDMIRRIEQQGSIELDDPTDMEEVRLEEERFWNETWDLPDED